MAVSREGNWTGWVAFFLKSVTEQASENQQKAHAIGALYDRTLRQIADLTHSQYAMHAAEFLFCRPIFKASGTPNRIRTGVTRMRTWRPRPLDDGGVWKIKRTPCPTPPRLAIKS